MGINLNQNSIIIHDAACKNCESKSTYAVAESSSAKILNGTEEIPVIIYGTTRMVRVTDTCENVSDLFSFQVGKYWRETTINLNFRSV